MTAVSANDQVHRIVLTLLADKSNPTQEQIRHATEGAIQVLQMTGTTVNVDIDRLTRDIEASFNVWVASASIIENAQQHIEWLGNRKPDIPWSFWDRYQRYLEEVKKLPPASIRRIDEITDAVLKRLEDPTRLGAWDRRGMVVGQVQSGKTSHYTGLICKAADAGYRLIVVLAGLYDNLRAQTQGRLDEGFLGFDTQQRMMYDANNTKIGVGALPGAKFLVAHSLTSGLEKGDFKLNVARSANVVVGGRDPVLLVVKKNTSILKNLIKWATLIRQQVDPDSGRAVVPGVPMLVIDDEADNASINTNDFLDENGIVQEEYDPTKINGYIRKLLHSFEQKGYVGYTATPFANIFIHKDASTAEYGDDLFPRSFIVNLPAPSNYIGPVQVFGQVSEEEVTEERIGLPIIETVTDYSTWLPNKHKKTFVPGDLPESMIRAVYSFILACAAREARGQHKVHNSPYAPANRIVCYTPNYDRRRDSRPL